MPMMQATATATMIAISVVMNGASAACAGSAGVGSVEANAAAGCATSADVGSAGAGAAGSGSIGCAADFSSDTMNEVYPADGMKYWSPSKRAVTT